MTIRRKSNGVNGLMDWNWNNSSTNQIQMEVDKSRGRALVLCNL